MAKPITIQNVKVFLIQTASAATRFIIVKVITSEPGLYGLGCATFTQRFRAVASALQDHLVPFALGKDVSRIEEFFQMAMVQGSWRNGPVLNNAISGIDQALWDIKGKLANMPVYQLLGGKCREAADTYAHASGGEIPQVIESAKAYISQGFRHVRVQVGVPGMEGYGAGGQGTAPLAGLTPGPIFEPAYYIRRAMKLFEECRKQLPEEIELLHDVHERVSPNQAVQFCKDAEKFKLFFVEDPLSPEDIAYFRQIRQQCATPIAMGELFNSPHEWTPLIAERLIDYMRMHVSQVGGVTPCRKIAAMGEIFGVKTAWHGPGDVSPIGHCANIALDLACYNFGIQEYSPFNERVQEVFHGCPVVKDGYLYANEAPGWGIEVDEKAAAKVPFTNNRNGLNGGWGEVRRLDGTIIKQ